MITGYNTDVRHRELVVHVQTEDKGRANPFIESLIYLGGRVVASKRLGYQELLDRGAGEKEIVARMEQQHRTIIAAIRGGKFDARLERLLAEKKGAGQEGEPPQPKAVVAAGAARQKMAVPEGGKSLDEVILDYLTSEAEQEQLVLIMNGESALIAGEATELILETKSSKTGEPVAGARVGVKLLSTLIAPRVLAEGTTDDAGRLRLKVDIPAVDPGTAALIVAASSPLGRAEIKHLL